MDQTVTLNIDHAIATISFNRSDDMNTYNLEMSKALLDVTETLLNEQNVRVVLLRGNGPAFMAGGDIRYFQERMDSMPEGVRDIIRTLAATVHNLRSLSQPVIAVVHGAVAGAGLSLMLAADMVIASQETKFTAAYSALGVSPDGGMSYFLPRHVGTKKAMELMLLSEQFSAEEAKHMGLVNVVCDKNALDDTSATLSKKCLAMPPLAIQNIKQLTYQAESQSLSSQLENEADSFVDLVQTEDFRARVNAFLNK